MRQKILTGVAGNEMELVVIYVRLYMSRVYESSVLFCFFAMRDASRERAARTTRGSCFVCGAGCADGCSSTIGVCFCRKWFSHSCHADCKHTQWHHSGRLHCVVQKCSAQLNHQRSHALSSTVTGHCHCNIVLVCCFCDWAQTSNRR